MRAIIKTRHHQDMAPRLRWPVDRLVPSEASSARPSVCPAGLLVPTNRRAYLCERIPFGN
jgi:hypothetical protein